MAEKRCVSKCISISEKVNLLPDIFDMLLFTWLIPHTDDFGRLAGSPAKVKALVVPMLDKTIRDVEKSLKHLHDANLIIWYEISDEKVVQVVNFEKHQQGLHKRTKSKFPEFPGNSRNVPEIPSEENRREENGIEGKGREGNRSEENGVPTFDNPHNKKIDEWLKKYNVKCRGISELEEMCSYIGTMDIEVIEHCIKKAENQHVPYAKSILDRYLREKKTTKESILPKAGDTSAKTGTSVQHERAAPEDKPYTGGAVGWLPGKYNKGDNIVQLPNVSG